MKATTRAGLIIALLLLAIAIAALVPYLVHAHDRACVLPASNVCIQNLKAIGGAKDCWALTFKKDTNSVPTITDIQPYIVGSSVPPQCPSGGVYTLGPVGQSPKCSIPGHVLPQ